jgi:ubiquinone/menaquinone biosynthesis C-methylase UbiE/uncharacterized protein YbaR (Trm112 family)
MLKPSLEYVPNFLRCPACLAAPLSVSGSISTTGAGLIDGSSLWCPVCGLRYSIMDGILDLVDGSNVADWRTVESHQWDSQASNYNAARQSDLIYMAGVDAVTRALAPSCGDRVLDAGCGTGLALQRMALFDADFVELDLSRESLRQLKMLRFETLRPIVYVRGDLTTLPFIDSTFNKVLCANTLQHIPTHQLREDCLSELRRVSRDGARVVVSVHNFSKPKKRHGWPKEGSAGGHSGQVKYIYRFDAQEFADLVSRHFSIEKLFGVGMPLPYRYKLSPLMRITERILQRHSMSTHWGNMLVAVGRAA